MIRHLKQLVITTLASMGWRLVKIYYQNPNGFKAAIERLNMRGPQLFNTVIDIGASDGRWTREVMKCFPAADYFLVEAQPVHEPALKAFCAGRANVRHILSAAGKEEGELFFDASDPFGGIASYEPVQKNGIRVPVTTIDRQVTLHGLRPPFLLKFDTHGFEMPILKGAVATLPQTAVIIMECYNFKIAPDSLLFYEMCDFLATQGFRPIDMFDIFCRPLDNALWQMDLVFMRDSRPEFQSANYK